MEEWYHSLACQDERRTVLELTGATPTAGLDDAARPRGPKSWQPAPGLLAVPGVVIG